MEKNGYHLIYILPVLFLLNGLFFYPQIRPFYNQCVDPEYAYLYNGLNLSQLKLYLGHIDHPGTPLQLLVAIIIGVVNLFRIQAPLMEDVLANPELYLSAVSMFLIVFNFIALVLLGYYITKLFNDVLPGMLFQLAPFLYIATITVQARILPETLMIAYMCFYILVLYYVVYKNPKHARNYLFLAIISAFGLSLKVTFLPFLIVPLFILKRNQALKYASLTIVFFFIFSFPVLLQLGKFTVWIGKLFMHSGAYGHGEKNIVNIPRFFEILSSIATRKFLFVVALGLVPIAIFRKPGTTNQGSTTPHTMEKKMLAGLAVAVLVQILVVAKHYDGRYLVPTMMLSVPVIYSSIRIIRPDWVKITNKGMRFSVILALVLLSFFHFGHFYTKVSILAKTKQQREETQSYLKSIQHETVIVSSAYAWCPYIEYAHDFGVFWAGRKNTADYKAFLNKRFPDTYIYKSNTHQLEQMWDKKDPTAIFKPGETIYFYFFNKGQGQKAFELASEYVNNFSPAVVYENEKTGEVCYRVDVPVSKPSND